MANKLYDDSGTQYDDTDTSYDGNSIISRIFTDGIGLVDSYSRSLNKMLADAIRGIEYITKSSFKSFIDLITESEIFIKVGQFSRTFIDSITSLEIYSKLVNFVRTFTDSITNTDSIIKNTNKKVIDSITSIEVFTRFGQFYRNVIDSIKGSEKLHRFLNGVEQIWNSITKPSASVYTQDSKPSDVWTDDDKPNHL